MARPLSPTSSALPPLSSDPDAMRRRLLQLEDSSAKAWAERSSLENRVLQLECDRKTTAQGFDSIAMRLKELGNMLHDLPSAPALHSAVNQFHWLPESRSAGHSMLEEVLARMDGRLLLLDDKLQNAERKVTASEAMVADASRTQFMKYMELVESKLDKADHDSFAASIQKTCAELRSMLDGKADTRETERLAEALNHSYRDFMKKQEEMTMLERNYNELSTSLSTLDDACQGLKKSFVRRQEETMKAFAKPDAPFPWPSLIAPMPPSERLESPLAFQRRLGAAGFKNSSQDRSTSPGHSTMGFKSSSREPASPGRSDNL